jgi:hypothetical protein
MSKRDPIKSDPMLPQIANQFSGHDVEKSGGGYLIIDPGSASPVARLRPIPNTDRFELLYWSNLKTCFLDLCRPQQHSLASMRTRFRWTMMRKSSAPLQSWRNSRIAVWSCRTTHSS